MPSVSEVEISEIGHDLAVLQVQAREQLAVRRVDLGGLCDLEGVLRLVVGEVLEPRTDEGESRAHADERDEQHRDQQDGEPLGEDGRQGELLGATTSHTPTGHAPPIIKLMVHCAPWGERCANDPVRHHPVTQVQEPILCTRASQPVPELLAPAGGPDALRAAVANGADAVYLGVEGFNARRGAENFTLASLSGGLRLRTPARHARLPDGEHRRAGERAGRGPRHGRPGVGRGRRRRDRPGPGTPSHRPRPHSRTSACTRRPSSTLTTRSPSRPSARSASPESPSRARSPSRRSRASWLRSPVEVESFVHGALCVCYSGQCLHVLAHRPTQRQPGTLRAAVPAAVRARRRGGQGARHAGRAPAVAQGPRRHRGAARSSSGQVSRRSRSRAA